METSGLFHYSPGPEAMETLGLLHYSTGPETVENPGPFQYSLGSEPFHYSTRPETKGLGALLFTHQDQKPRRPQGPFITHYRIKDSHALVTCNERPEQRKEHLLTVSVLTG